MEAVKNIISAAAENRLNAHIHVINRPDCEGMSGLLIYLLQEVPPPRDKRCGASCKPNTRQHGCRYETQRRVPDGACQRPCRIEVRGNKNYKVGETVVELDQFKTELNSYEGPLVEVRDSL